MVKCWCALLTFLAILLVSQVAAGDEGAGSIRGMVSDKDFETPLAGATVRIVELDEKVTPGEGGNYVFATVPAGTYTMVFTKDGYAQQVRNDVNVVAGQMTELNAALAGEVVEMDEFLCQDTSLGAGSEENLLALRADSAALINGISADQISKAAAGDAAQALKLVTGASVQDDKYAVIRGLPDRYVVSQMNGVRLPTADVDKRAVQLDQFPAAVIQQMAVAKTFTPDQQGDASGGAVNVILKGIPDENMVKVDVNGGVNTQSSFDDKFPKGAGLNCLGLEHHPDTGKFTGPVGVSDGSSNLNENWCVTAGGKRDIGDGWRVGGLGSIFYKHDYSSIENGVNDTRWSAQPGASLTPFIQQGSTDGVTPFKTALYDINQGTEQVKWGGLGVVGLENEKNSIRLTDLYTHSAQSTAILAEDTRGKKYFFPDYNVNDPASPGNANAAMAPYLRTETLTDTERTTQTLQLSGKHTLETDEWGFGDFLKFKEPTIDWTGAISSASLDQPDTRKFGSSWSPMHQPDPTDVYPEGYDYYKPGESFTLGNLQRIWKTIDEDSDQGFINLTYPFEQWSGDEGYLKAGLFADDTTREYTQQSYANFNDTTPLTQAQRGWDDYWSHYFLDEHHPMTAYDGDVDYHGRQKISAWYWMADVPTCHYLDVVGGLRFEDTDLSIVNHPEPGAEWYPPGHDVPTKIGPGDADVSYRQHDVLPSIGLIIKPTDKIKIYTVYSQTVARQTFKELSPIGQEEYLGGPEFRGNPDLRMASVDNYDIRLDYTPAEGTLYSAGWFYKDVTDPIEYVQRIGVSGTYTSPDNYPKGSLDGFELEARQKMGRFFKSLDGLTLGGNATIISSQVDIPADEQTALRILGDHATTRHMIGAPDYLLNLFSTYDIERYGTQLGLFYTLKGDTLVAGAGAATAGLLPDVYEESYGTLNFTVGQRLSQHWKLNFQAKNLLDPAIETAYRYHGADTTQTSFHKGVEFWLGLSATWK